MFTKKIDLPIDLSTCPGEAERRREVVQRPANGGFPSPLSHFLSISLFRPGCLIFVKFLSHLHYSFRSALPGSCGLQMVRIGKELQDGLLQLVTAAIFRDYLCIVRQWGDSVTPARRRMLFAKESVLEPIKFLTTCYSLPGNEM